MRTMSRTAMKQCVCCLQGVILFSLVFVLGFSIARAGVHGHGPSAVVLGFSCLIVGLTGGLWNILQAVEIAFRFRPSLVPRPFGKTSLHVAIAGFAVLLAVIGWRDSNGVLFGIGCAAAAIQVGTISNVWLTWQVQERRRMHEEENNIRRLAAIQLQQSIDLLRFVRRMGLTPAPSAAQSEGEGETVNLDDLRAALTAEFGVLPAGTFDAEGGFLPPPDLSPLAVPLPTGSAKEPSPALKASNP